MTWCSKIYDIFNGWSDEDLELPSTPATKSINGLPESSIAAKIRRYHSTNDSAFHERSHSISSVNNPSNYYRKKSDEPLADRLTHHHRDRSLFQSKSTLLLWRYCLSPGARALRYRHDVSQPMIPVRTSGMHFHNFSSNMSLNLPSYSK